MDRCIKEESELLFVVSGLLYTSLSKNKQTNKKFLVLPVVFPSLSNLKIPYRPKLHSGQYISTWQSSRETEASLLFFPSQRHKELTM